MLGTVHNLMIRHLIYKALPHREGEGGPGHVTSPRQEFRRQLRVARKADVFAHFARMVYQQHALRKPHLVHQRAGLLRHMVVQPPRRRIRGMRPPVDVPHTRQPSLLADRLADRPKRVLSRPAAAAAPRRPCRVRIVQHRIENAAAPRIGDYYPVHGGNAVRPKEPAPLRRYAAWLRLSNNGESSASNSCGVSTR
jgi:hypothetical protein